MSNKFDELTRIVVKSGTLRGTLKYFGLGALALGCAAVFCGGGRAGAQATLPANAANITGNAGVTFVFTPTSDPNIFAAAADGVVDLSLVGNWSEHAQLQVQFPTTPGQPVILSGNITLTSSDGANSLSFTVTGIAIPDPTNPEFFNNSYQVTFTGGTGAFANAHGSGSVNEVVKFTSPLTGTGTWKMKGYVLTPPAGP